MEVSEGVDLLSPAAGDEAAEDRCGATSPVAAGKQPVLSAQHDGPNRVLGRVVVDVQVAVVAVTRQRRPVVQRVADGLADRALGQDRNLLLLKPLLDLFKTRL